MKKAIIMDKNDNIATVLDDINKGEKIMVISTSYADINTIASEEYIPFGHKVALINIDAGKYIKKFGENIGLTSANIQKGKHVHIHNLVSNIATKE